MEYFQHFNYRALQSSTHVNSWIHQFREEDQSIAISLLMNLRIVTREQYANFILKRLQHYSEHKCALYAVRKYKSNAKSAWTPSGKMNIHNATTLGSEDLVRSIINTAIKDCPDNLYDHPSVYSLRKHQIKDIILLEDSIGSGNRVAKFLKLFFKNTSLLSWWSYGWIRIHVISYARTIQSEAVISKGVPGSNHGKRKFPTSKKLSFDSEYVYNASTHRKRWGKMADSIRDLCLGVKQIHRDRRLGYGNIMGNVIFTHSIPNNIPGILFSSAKGWKPLFPNRAAPAWLEALLQLDPSQEASIPPQALDLLQLINSGVRHNVALARRMNTDSKIIRQIVEACEMYGLIIEGNRLTEAGLKYLEKNKLHLRKDFTPDYSLYIPSSWCADHSTV